MTQSYHRASPDIPKDRRDKALPQIPPQARRKLQKNRQKHVKATPRSIPVTRSSSILSGDSRHRLLHSDAPPRTHNPRYPRSSRPSVLRKRRGNARRSYYSVSTLDREQQQPIHEEGQYHLEPVSEQVNPRHSFGASEHPLLHNTPPSPIVRRRWSMSEATADKIVPNVEKELPALPTATPEILSSSRRYSNLPPLPLDSPITNDPYQQRLCNDFVQGERLYLDTLRQCVKNEDIFTTSLDLLLSLLSVIQVVQDFVSQMESLPTPKGIASSFLAVCRPLEASLLRWSAEIARIPTDEVFNMPGSPQTALDSNHRRHQGSIFRRVSVLWSRKSNRPSTAPMLRNKPDRMWQKPTSGPGLWEISVLPAQRVTQYRYLLREILLTLTETHESYSEVERAFQAATFISQTVTRSQEKSRP